MEKKDTFGERWFPLWKQCPSLLFLLNWVGSYRLNIGIPQLWDFSPAINLEAIAHIFHSVSGDKVSWRLFLRVHTTYSSE